MARAMTKGQIAKKYGVATSTLYRWFRRNPLLKALVGPGKYLTPDQVELVRETLGDWD